MAAVPRWMRRLFGQLDLDAEQTLGADLKFTGIAAQLPITDNHRAAAIRCASTPDGRMHASYGYLMKVLKNATRGADDRHDAELSAMLDQARERVAEAVLALTEQLKTNIAELGYADDYTGDLEEHPDARTSGAFLLIGAPEQELAGADSLPGDGGVSGRGQTVDPMQRPPTFLVES